MAWVAGRRPPGLPALRCDVPAVGQFKTENLKLKTLPEAIAKRPVDGSTIFSNNRPSFPISELMCPLSSNLEPITE